METVWTKVEPFSNEQHHEEGCRANKTKQFRHLFNDCTEAPNESEQWRDSDQRANT